MYIRRTHTNNSATGERYYTYRLVANQRIGGKPRQSTLLNLGRQKRENGVKYGLRKNVKKTKKYKYFTKSESYEIAITAKMVTKKGLIKDEDKKRIGKIEHVLNKNSIAANWIDIDTEKGSAASYICKYISKSCLFDASQKSKFNDQDEDSLIQRNQKFENEYNALLGVASTRSTFNLRSFQFYGLPHAAIAPTSVLPANCGRFFAQ